MTAKHIGIVLLTLALTAGAHAEKTIEQRLEELDQEIRILKRQREIELEAAAAKPKPPRVASG